MHFTCSKSSAVVEVQEMSSSHGSLLRISECSIYISTSIGPKFQTDSSCRKGPIKHLNKSVQMKVIPLYFCNQTHRLNIISVSSAEMEVEIFLSYRVKPLHEFQTVLDSLCFSIIKVVQSPF